MHYLVIRQNNNGNVSNEEIATIVKALNSKFDVVEQRNRPLLDPWRDYPRATEVTSITLHKSNQSFISGVHLIRESPLNPRSISIVLTADQTAHW